MPHHVIQEVIDNAADEALAGQATRIDVTVCEDGSVIVEDKWSRQSRLV
ncbi:DNA topoisomerase IV subunit B, partial [Acidithiobacillus sp. GGI-221]